MGGVDIFIPAAGPAGLVKLNKDGSLDISLEAGVK